MFNIARMSESGFIDLIGKFLFYHVHRCKTFLDTPVIIGEIIGDGDRSGDSSGDGDRINDDEDL